MSYVSPRKSTKVGKQVSSLFHKGSKTKAYYKKLAADKAAKQQAYLDAVARWQADQA